tara:strand:+ start:418 stop:672 length:255 start_codon:yes stop_codon:yes gene_type:complete
MKQYLVDFLSSVFFIYVILATNNAIIIGLTTALIYMLYQTVPNPAVSIIFASAGKLPIEKLIPTCISQIFGCLVGFELFKRYKF